MSQSNKPNYVPSPEWAAMLAEFKEDMRPANVVPIRAEQQEARPPVEVKYPPRSVGEHIDAVGKMEWWLDGVIPKGETGAVVGQPKTGKSFLTFDMVAAVAQGVPWRGRPARKTRVALIVAEGKAGSGGRLQAYLNSRGITREDLAGIDIYPYTPNLFRKEDAIALNASLQAGVEKYALELSRKLGRKLTPDEREGCHYGIIVPDTFAATTSGINENSGEHVGKVLEHWRLITDAQSVKRPDGSVKVQTMVLIVHHLGKDASKGARGWSGFEGHVDVLITVSRDGNARQAVVTMLKEGEEGAVYAFELEEVVVGEDVDKETGEVTKITSCVVKHDERPGAPTKSTREPATKAQKPIYRVVCELAALAGGEVSLDAVIEAAVPKLMQDPTKEDQRRKRVLDAVQRLVDDRWLAPGSRPGMLLVNKQR